MVFRQAVISIIVILVIGVIYFILLNYFKRFMKKKSVSSHSVVAMRKFFDFVTLLVLVMFLLVVWGADVKNAFIFIGGVLALVAVGFFAVWSVLSNIFAAFILFATRPFKVGDNIKILSDSIEGKVKDVTLMFIVLEDSEGNKINIPNNMIFQRIVLTMKKG